MFHTETRMSLIKLLSPVAVSTADWDVLSFSAGRVISAKPAATRPCGKKEDSQYVCSSFTCT